MNSRNITKRRLEKSSSFKLEFIRGSLTTVKNHSVSHEIWELTAKYLHEFIRKPFNAIRGYLEKKTPNSDNPMGLAN